MNATKRNIIWRAVHLRLPRQSSCNKPILSLRSKLRRWLSVLLKYLKLPIFYLKISLNDRMCNDFFLFILNKHIQELDVPIVSGSKDMTGGVRAGGQRQQLRSHRLTLFPCSYKIFGTLLFLFRYVILINIHSYVLLINFSSITYLSRQNDVSVR